MHAALPQTMTIESLAQWITENRKDTQVSKATKLLTPEERSEYEHISSDCSQKIDELDEIKKQFGEFLSNGTYNPEVDEENGKIVTIPATVGIKKLTEERKRVDKLLRDGYTTENTTLYIIPWPEEKKMVAFTIEGEEFEEFTRDMREDEINKYRTLFESAPVEFGENGDSEEQGVTPVMEVNTIVDEDPFGVDGPSDDKEEEQVQIEDKPRRRSRAPKEDLNL